MKGSWSSQLTMLFKKHNSRRFCKSRGRKEKIDSNIQSTRWKNAPLTKLGWSIRWKKWCYYEKTIPIDKTQDEKMLLWQSIRWRW